MKIVADAEIPFVKEAFAEFGRVIAVPAQEITSELLKDATMLLVRSVTKVDSKLLAGTSVRFVATASIGTDHIDNSYLENESIGFASAPGSNADSVSDYIVAALLHLAEVKKITLHDCTIGIIGVGNVGSRVMKSAQALGMTCLLNDPPKKRITNSDIFVSLEDVLGKSDIVTLHVPLTMEGPDKTYRMVAEDFIGRMKDGAIFINTSRGKVVDEDYLCKLAVKKIGGMVIDVWDGEPAINTGLLRLADIATPHIAGHSYDGKVRGTGMIHDAACAFYFKDKLWDMDKVLMKNSGGTIDLTKSKKPVYDIVKNAYPIIRDDKNLRNMLELKEDTKAGYFDELRRQYPKRLEFTHFSVKSGNLNKKDRDIITGLGFALKE